MKSGNSKAVGADSKSHGKVVGFFSLRGDGIGNFLKFRFPSNYQCVY